MKRCHMYREGFTIYKFVVYSISDLIIFRGFLSRMKKNKIKSLIHEEKLDFMTIQEIKMTKRD